MQQLIKTMKVAHGKKWAEKLLELFEDLSAGKGWPSRHLPEEDAYKMYISLFDWLEKLIKGAGSDK